MDGGCVDFKTYAAVTAPIQIDSMVVFGDLEVIGSMEALSEMRKIQFETGVEVPVGDDMFMIVSSIGAVARSVGWLRGRLRRSGFVRDQDCCAREEIFKQRESPIQRRSHWCGMRLILGK